MKPLLLDTVVLLWWLSGKGPLATGVTIRLRQLTTPVYVSVATAWEICALERKGRVDFGRPAGECLPAELTAHRFEWLPLDHRHIFLAQQLTATDLDPYDRLILAQATIEGLALVTTNGRMRRNGVETMDAREPEWRNDGRPAVRVPTIKAAAMAADAASIGVVYAAAVGTVYATGMAADERGTASDATADAARDAGADSEGTTADADGTTTDSVAASDSPENRPLPAWNAFPWGGATDAQHPA